MRLIFFILVTFIASCSNIESNENSTTDTTTKTSDSITTSQSDIETDFTKDSVITIKFPNDSSSITVTGRMNGINKPVAVNIPITKGKKLNIVLTPEDSIANVRINQIFMPNGKADGPFGRKLEQQIKQYGNYKIIIAENLMQGEEWKGNFRLTVTVM